MAYILEINNVDLTNGLLTVEAVVDEMLLYRRGSYYEPEEWGPATCWAEYELTEDEVFPENEKEQIEFLEELDLNWKLVDYECD